MLKNAMQHRILLRESEEGFSVSCPGLPGCWSQGGTEQEAIDNIKEAIQDYLAVVEEMTDGQNVRVINIAA